MKLLYIGDIMGPPGIQTVERVLPELRERESIDIIVAQAENVTDGKSMSREDYERLRGLGIDGFTGGNHTPSRSDIVQLLEDPEAPVVGPVNMPSCPGPGYKFMNVAGRRVLLISAMGQTVGKGASLILTNPLTTLDETLASLKDEPRDATVVNLHGDYSSEKLIYAYYLDGRASLVVGDHWHIQTADADVLAKGTARITDVGMCGSLDSSLGVTFDSVIPRWRDGIQTRNMLELSGRMQFNAVLVTIDDQTGKALAIDTIRTVL